MVEFLDLLMDRNNPALRAKLKAAVVGIAGCGGLGSNVACSLARIGVGKLVLADFDEVQPSNLNRQQFVVDDIGRQKVDALSDGIAAINPYVEITAHDIRLTEDSVFDVFRECRIIVEAFDTAEDKAMIMRSFADERFKSKFLVAGSGLAGSHSSNLIETRKLACNIYVCGDFLNAPDQEHGVMAPRVMIVAGHQANMVVRLIGGIFDV